MKITSITNHLTQLTRLKFVNCYFVHEPDGLTLIDAALPGSAPAILRAAADIGQPIKRITLTHGHGDHVGALDALVEALPDAEIIFGTRTADFLAGKQTLTAAEPQAKLRGSFVTSDVVANRLVTDGDQIGSLKVIASPGHTPDHLAFLDMRDGSLIAGDAFQTLGGLAVAGQLRWRFPLPALATWHKETAVSSASKLHALNPNRLAVGHGKVVENPAAAILEVIQEAVNK